MFKEGDKIKLKEEKRPYLTVDAEDFYGGLLPNMIEFINHHDYMIVSSVHKNCIQLEGAGHFIYDPRWFELYE